MRSFLREQTLFRHLPHHMSMAAEHLSLKPCDDVARWCAHHVHSSKHCDRIRTQNAGWQTVSNKTVRRTSSRDDVTAVEICSQGDGRNKAFVAALAGNDN